MGLNGLLGRLGRAVAGLVILAAMLAWPSPAVAAVRPPPASTTRVVGACTSLAVPSYPSITAAITAAAAGDTIYVCPGIYVEDVVIDKVVTLLGAQWGVDARSGRTNPAEESVVVGTNPFAYAGGGVATTGTIDGFTVEDVAGGINGFSADGAGYTWIDNIVTGGQIGYNFDASGVGAATLIEHNRISRHAQFGIAVTSRAATDVTINENAFVANNSAAVNLIERVTDAKITGNTSVNDASFLVASNVNRALVGGNTISRPDLGTGTAILIGGGATDVTISSNTITDGASNGITISTALNGNPATGINVLGNTINHRLAGIRINRAVSGLTVSGNRIADSGVGYAGDPANMNGLWVTTATGASVDSNLITNSVTNDCRDDTTGAATAGTANVWTGNVGVTSSPAGICLARPAITGAATATRINAGGQLGQTVTVSATLGLPGTLTWQLLGPVAQVGGSCASTSFADAPVLASGTLAVTGDGPVTVPMSIVNVPGCYSFADSLTGERYAPVTPIPAGTDPNTALVVPILPVTGIDVHSFVVASAVLIALGAGLLLAARICHGKRRSADPCRLTRLNRSHT